jgi:hypothetical protein
MTHRGLRRSRRQPAFNSLHAFGLLRGKPSFQHIAG